MAPLAPRLLHEDTARLSAGPCALEAPHAPSHMLHVAHGQAPGDRVARYAA